MAKIAKTKKKRTTLLAWIVGLFIAQFALHGAYITDFWSRNFSPGTKSGNLLTGGVSPDQLLLELFGFREFLSGILWVRADAFFDDGNYDAVLPIIRLCTMLDPKNIDVYATGMWHIAYNFTDDEQRSDRRNVTPALALGREGAANNPQTYELYFEEGWLWFHKVDDDYDNAVKWFGIANGKPDIIPARRNLLGHAYERDGKPDQELKTFYGNLDYDKQLSFLQEDLPGLNHTTDTVQDNIDNTIVRMVQRGYIAEQNGYYNTGDYDTKPPFDVGFSAKVTVEDPKVIHVQGTWNVLPLGTRIRFVLRDDEIYDRSGTRRIDKPAEMDWEYTHDVDLNPRKDITFMQDELFVKNRHFDKRMDMSKDPTMYPFRKGSEKYAIEFYYNPRSAATHIKDKFGFNGEGMTDQRYLNTQVRSGQRVMYCKLYLTRDQLLRRGEWQDKVPVVETPNYKESSAIGSDDRIITLGSNSLRDQEMPTAGPPK